MPRPARKLSAGIINTLGDRPRLRYTLTKKGQKALESGDTPHGAVLDNLVEAIQANNKQPVSLITWKKFHAPGKINSPTLKDLVQRREISIVSRGKFGFAVE